MGLMLSVIISYAGVLEAIDCANNIMYGMLPDTEPDFRDLVAHYNMMLQKCSNQQEDWTQIAGQGYLCLTEDEDGKLKSASLKYHDSKTDSAAILFSTKITSFGQESVENAHPKVNGDCKRECTPTRTKTITTDNLSESIIVGQQRQKSPTNFDNTTDSSRLSPSPYDNERNETDAANESQEKLTWHYRPRSPVTPPLPEINFQPSEGGKEQESLYSEDYLRSLDGIKLRPFQRSDPSGRRRSFRKRHSSSSNSSRESRASREEELKMFTSLEEAEFELMNREQRISGFGVSSNLATRSHSRSRESSKERRHDAWSMDASVDSVPEDDSENTNAQAKSAPKLNSLSANTEDTQVMEEEEIEDFWGNNSGD